MPRSTELKSGTARKVSGEGATMFSPELFLALLTELAGRRPALLVEGLPLSALSAGFPRLAQILDREVRSGAYELRPLRPFRAQVGGKLRQLHRSELLDRVLLMAIGRALSSAIEPHLSPRNHSYRKGHSTQRTLLEFSRWLRERTRDERGQALPTFERGVFVLKTDVSAYGESLRTDPESPLWLELQALEQPELLEWVKKAVFQPIAQEGTLAKPLSLGTPTGSPVQPPLNSLYLNRLDHRLAALPGLFYSRFGDDLLLAHSRREHFELALEILRGELQDCALSLKLSKTQRVYFNGAGRASVDGDYPGAQYLEYLGSRLDFGGNLELSREKTRRIWRELEERLENLAATFEPEESLESKTRCLCSAVRQLFDEGSALAHPLAGEFRCQVFSAQARVELSRRLEVKIAELATGKSGRRALRLLAPKQQRSWGFPRLDRPYHKVLT